MDDIEEVFEQWFDDAGSWTRPPRPVDAKVYDAEVRQGIDGCLDRVPTNQRRPLSCVRSKECLPKKSVRFWRSRALT